MRAAGEIAQLQVKRGVDPVLDQQLVEADAWHAAVSGGRAYAALIFERLLLAPLVVARSPRMTPSASWICARMPAASIRC